MIKMSNLELTRKEFEAYKKVKKFIEVNNHKKIDLIPMLTEPIYINIPLIV